MLVCCRRAKAWRSRLKRARKNSGIHASADEFAGQFIRACATINGSDFHGFERHHAVFDLAFDKALGLFVALQQGPHFGQQFRIVRTGLREIGFPLFACKIDRTLKDVFNPFPAIWCHMVLFFRL